MHISYRIGKKTHILSILYIKKTELLFKKETTENPEQCLPVTTEIKAITTEETFIVASERIQTSPTTRVRNINNFKLCSIKNKG